MRIILTVFIMMFIPACSQEVAESMRFNDSMLEKLTLDQIRLNKIAFEKDSNGNIWYSSADRELLIKISRQVASEYARGITIKDIGVQREFEAELESRDIDYRSVTGKDDSRWYIFDEKDRSQALTIFSDKVLAR